MSACIKNLTFRNRAAECTPQPEARALLAAVVACDIEQVRQLLATGAPVNGRGDFGLSPLHVACRIVGLQTIAKRHPAAEAMIALLLEHGADAAAVDAFHYMPAAWCEGQTPSVLRAHMQKLAAANTWPTIDPDHCSDEWRRRVAKEDGYGLPMIRRPVPYYLRDAA
jgi:hypothetical protein